MAPPQPGQQSANASVIAPGWTGEQRQMRVGVAVVFMQMQMDDRDVWRKPVQELEIVVSGGGTKIGMAQIKAHPDLLDGRQIQPAQLREQFVEILRRW